MILNIKFLSLHKKSKPKEMKRFKLTIIVTTEDNFDQNEFSLIPDDVIDGFELTRNTDNITDEFKMRDAYIQNIIEL